MSELVTVTIDDREVEVERGTGLVETAASAGIEIPVFCYEPRLGPPVGACRMCLVEVEGLPKLQAGCTLTAQDGMVVRTAASSEKAAEGQNATLEFILVNHPLDCPVCDKGGECPLQDLTFRYGPGNTRMSFSKITLEKPIPISPTIALDRERCILCYRCTRFSADVAEDNQLVARNRGAHTEITTFADDPYRAPFSGNVIELCPVGALTSTQYRFEARPWEIQNVPTVCGLCPVGCNTSVTTREGKVKRVLSRNHPEIDEGWLCDKGRFANRHLYADDRITEPLRRGKRGLEEISWDDALDDAERLLRAAGTHIVTALSGTETVEQAYALARLVRGGLGAHNAVFPEEVSSALDPFRLPLSAIRDAQIVVVVGGDSVLERAPIVDLWLKAARRKGARVDEVAGPELDAPLAAEMRAAERAILIWSGPHGEGGVRVAALASALGLHGRPGSGAFYLPSTPNGRGVCEAWAAADDADETDPHPIGLLIVSGDEAAADPAVRALAERAEAVVAVTLFHGLAVGWADLLLPGTSNFERDGTLVNLEGRAQRLRRAVLPPVPDELPGSRSSRRGSTSRSRRMRRSCSTSSRPRSSAAPPSAPWATTRRCRRRRRSPSCRRSSRPTSRSPQRSAFSATPRSSPAPPSSARPSCTSSDPSRRSNSRVPTPRVAASARATRSSSPRTAPRSPCARASRARSRRGSRGSPRSTPARCPPAWR